MANQTPPTARPGDRLPATDVERAAALLTSDPPAAERAARRLAELDPADPRPRLILASAHRRQGDARGALALLEPLSRAFPRAAQTRYELGLVHAALGDPGRAIDALRQAVGLNRDLADAWRALGELLFAAGDSRGAEAAFTQFTRAAVSDPALRPAAEALAAGGLDEAVRRLEAHLAAAPADVAALNLLGEARLRQGAPEAAEGPLTRATGLDAGHAAVRFNLARALFEQHRWSEAVDLARGLIAAEPSSRPYRNLLAAGLSRLGDEEGAIAIFQSLLAEAPAQPRLWLNMAQALRAVGRGGEAQAAYRHAIALAPGLGEAWAGLADLKVAAFTASDEAAIAAQLAAPDLAADDRALLEFALGKALEDRGEIASAFAAYQRGARLRRLAVPYDAAATTALFARIRHVFTAQALAGQGAGEPQDGPIFIVGLPRSGSTLVEQILASHPAVEGLGELPDIGLIARAIDRAGGYPEGVAALDRAALAELGERYLCSVDARRRLGRPLFTDKAPGNFAHIGLIALILPRARIIDARRHPLSAGVSVFRQSFAAGQAFSDDLADIGAYYRDYVGLMAHFDAARPGLVRRVIYEDLVGDTEGEVRRLLEGLGLPFDDACLRFWETRRAVRTISSEQVRRPIFREGLEQWRRFEPWLEPLKAALGPALEHWRGD